MKKLLANIMCGIILTGIMSAGVYAVDIMEDTESGFGPIIGGSANTESTTETVTEISSETITENDTKETTIGAEITTEATTSTEATTKRSSSGGGSGGGRGSNNNKTTETTIEPTTEAVTEKTAVEETTEITTEITTEVFKSGFNDIKEHWARAYIEFTVEKRLFSGLSDTEFGPDISLTRGMAITVIGRASNADVSGYTNSYKDVDENKYYASYIAWATENGIASGIGNNEFAPERTITRQEMAVFIDKARKLIVGETDVAIDDEKFVDDSDSAQWAVESVHKVKALGLITGRENNTFDPKDTATRAEFATVLFKLFNGVER